MPLRALSIATTGGKALQSTIDTISNNLANVNTVGYKKARTDFADLFYQYVEKPGSGLPGLNQNPNGIWFGTGVRLTGTTRIFTPGDFQNTNRNLDWAVDGDGFFRVTQPVSSQIAFTRAGNFNIDAQGNIVTPDGYLLAPQITVPQNISQITVTPTGLVQGFDPSNPTNVQQLGQLQLARFVNPSGLVSIGSNLYTANPAAGNEIDGQPGQPGFGLIRQGFLEQSNVDVISELVDLIQAQRAFETNSTSIRTADEILQNINRLRG